MKSDDKVALKSMYTPTTHIARGYAAILQQQVEQSIAIMLKDEMRLKKVV